MTPVPLMWSLVIPVKVLAQAKSRLTGLLAADRAALTLAMAADTVAAAMAAPAVAAVIVVTDDPGVGAEMKGLHAVVLADEPAAGLNPALAFGAAYSRGLWPERGVAGLAADLPALRPAELQSALTAAAALTWGGDPPGPPAGLARGDDAPGPPAGTGQAFVPDADGTGTTLYAAGPGVAFDPRFGPGSRARHGAGGATELDLPLTAGLRRDVDTLDDLRRAAAIGAGPRTAGVLASMADRLPKSGQANRAE
jgi:2-phospho-L-lactate/phosphoenolpyruvate guanylyltransferase